MFNLNPVPNANVCRLITVYHDLGYNPRPCVEQTLVASAEGSIWYVDVAFDIFVFLGLTCIVIECCSMHQLLYN